MKTKIILATVCGAVFLLAVWIAQSFAVDPSRVPRSLTVIAGPVCETISWDEGGVTKYKTDPYVTLQWDPPADVTWDPPYETRWHQAYRLDRFDALDNMRFRAWYYASETSHKVQMDDDLLVGATYTYKMRALYKNPYYMSGWSNGVNVIVPYCPPSSTTLPMIATTTTTTTSTTTTLAPAVQVIMDIRTLANEFLEGQ